ncbi:MAG: urea carboxylase-associated family protein [Bryobacterales bacterium]|nr:urea carboxylase-associated family protein [Bryobacterales bacterium]
MNDISVLFSELLPPGAMWSHVLKRGAALRLTDIEGGANASAIFFNFENLSERYNMPDTLKAQHIARLTAGAVLYSDMGRILCSITGDSLGWHDPISGCSDASLVLARYGPSTYQQSRNACFKNGRDSFLTEMAKWGLNERDLSANVNFFSKVVADGEGILTFVPNHSTAGSYVELRAEMNTLVILNSCPHPLNPSPTYDPKPIQLTVRKVPPPGPDDPCRLSRPENERGFLLTERYFL